MLRIQGPRTGKKSSPSGQIDEETITELKTRIDAEATGRCVALNLKDLTLVNDAAVIFLDRCESNGITLEDCPPYIREWVNRQRQGN